MTVDARALVPEDGLVWAEASAPDARPTLHLSLLRREGAGLPVHEFLAALFGADLAEPRWCAVTRIALRGRDDAGRWLTPFEEITRRRRSYWFQAHLND